MRSTSKQKNCRCYIPLTLGEELQIKFFARLFHIFAFTDPFVFSVLRVECTFLQPFQFQREAWAEFLQLRLRLVILLPVNVAMMSHKDEIPLIMKCYYLTPFEFGLLCLFSFRVRWVYQ